MICLGLIARTVPRFEAVMWEASCGPSSPRSRSSRNSAAGAASAPDALSAGALAEVAFDVLGHEGGFVFSKCHRECSSSELESLLIASRSKCSLSASETWAASVEYGARLEVLGPARDRARFFVRGRAGGLVSAGDASSSSSKSAPKSCPRSSLSSASSSSASGATPPSRRR